ncbi:N-methyl-L-tryptophan oxidase [Microlunatus spumicola]|uniref:N-methyl-L-tryptophan oxidase n=1 Tax=Microlunatus spumicola TaxID=81499 RepID=A0ABP6XG53_9ACTN
MTSPSPSSPVTQPYDADYAVVGLGAMGSHAFWRLAARGADVLGFEQFRPGHNQGSTHGSTRLFRTLCLEHPGLVPVARRSLALWRELEEQTGLPIVRITGGLMIGRPGSEIINGVREAAEVHGVEVRTLTAAEIRKEFPQHAGIDDEDVAILDPEAGVGRPENAVLAATRAAEAAGGRLVERVAVSGIELVDGGVIIRTAARDFTVRQVIVTAGPWMYQLLPSLPYQPIRTPLTWFTPAVDAAEFDLGRFPTFIRELPDGNRMWGHGSDTDHAVKIGPEDDPHYTLVNPDEVDRSISPADYTLVSELVSRYLPGLQPEPTSAAPCMITRSPDMQFILGRPHGDPRLLVGGGDSGHAFKHASGLGEALAQMAVGEPTYTDFTFTDPDRFL